MTEVRAYDHIIGLGHDCRLTYNLRRTFGFERAYPFDWWVTPLPALVAFLHDPSVERLYDPARLEPVIHKTGIFAIRNADYDIELQHEFPRTPKGVVEPDWREHIPKARARTDFLLRRMLALPAGSRLLFVRSTKKSEGRALGERFTPLVGEVRSALDARFRGSSTELLLIDPPQWIKAPGVTMLSVGDKKGRDWRGDPDLWTQRLRGAGLAWAASPSAAAAPPNPEADHGFGAAGG